MKENNIEGTQLERKVRSITVRVIAREDETLEELYVRLGEICENIDDAETVKEREAWTQDFLPEVEEARLRVKHLFGLTDEKRSDVGLTGDYHMVILSLLKSFDQCMGASAIAKEWNIIVAGFQESSQHHGRNSRSTKTILRNAKQAAIGLQRWV